MLPARAGEALRTFLVAGRVRASKREVLGTIIAERVLDAGVLAKYLPLVSPSSAQQFRLEGDAASRLTPIDYSDVCVNVDDGLPVATGFI